MAIWRFLSRVGLLALLAPRSVGWALSLGVERHELANGLPVLLRPVHAVPVTTLQVTYKCGSRDEVAGATGISHLLEHLMFDGSERYPAGAFDRLIEAAGGSSNGYTWKDVTAFMETFPPAALPLALELEADRMRALALTSEVLEMERGVVSEERRQTVEDDDDGAAWEALLSLMFRAYPYRDPVLGWMEDIQALSQPQVQTWYERCYAPANALLVLTGDFAPEEVLPALEAAFGALPAGEAVSHPRWNEQPQEGERRAVLRREVGQPSFVIGYLGPPAADLDQPALELLDQALSGGRAGVLVDALVYHREVLSDVSSFLIPLEAASLFMVEGTPAEGVGVEQALAALEEALARVRAEPLSEKALARARRAAQLSLVRELEGVEGSADLLATWELQAGGWERLAERPARWAEVSPEVLRGVAARWLPPDHRSVVLVMPLEAP
ncbi:MAG: pitrilysin family protein [Pseudomonadota bacterium]